MTFPRIVPVSAARLVNLTLAAMVLILTSTGCTNEEQSSPLGAPGTLGEVEVVGTLVAINDGRPVDGGVDLTLETKRGTRELVRVPSSFTAEPRDYVLAMHRVVDASKLGDRLRARGKRDPSGALQPDFLELISGPLGR